MLPEQLLLTVTPRSFDAHTLGLKHLEGHPVTRTCRCQLCYGLREELVRYGLNPRGIPAAPGCAPQTMPELTRTIACDGTYTCKCPQCEESTTRLKAHRAKYAVQ